MPKNVYFPGSVPNKELPYLMHNAKAGIIPFDINNRMDLIQGIRPLKLFEYMAAGLPVITARWPELELIKSPAWFYDDADKFSSLVSKAVNNHHEVSISKDFARQHDWKQSFQLMLNSL